MKTFNSNQVRRIPATELENLKLSKFVMEESGRRPVNVSVVIPTFNKKDPKYNKALVKVFSECCQLIDLGVIDEVVIAEGSRLEDGTPDYEFMEFILAVGMKYCNTFKSEVLFVQSLPEGRQRALEGRWDFSIRIMSQVDPELHQIFLKYGILTNKDLEVLKAGKGANIWYSIPVTFGDIICFVDSDIVSFGDYYIKGLVKPILEDWGKNLESDGNDSATVFSKAFYIRQHKRGKRKTIGGRLSRLAGRPLFKALAKRGILAGLDDVKYPFSGECAFTRNTLNNIQFSNGYDIETSVLCQLWKNYDSNSLSQSDLGVFRHIPGPEEHANNMLEEISMALFYWIRRYDLMDKLGDLDEFLDDYEKTARSFLKEYEGTARKMPTKVSYGPEEKMIDRERIKRYRGIIRRGFELSETREPKLLKPWSEIKSKMNNRRGFSYPGLKNIVQQRVNKFTSETILSKIHIHIDRTNEIIRLFAGR